MADPTRTLLPVTSGISPRSRFAAMSFLARYTGNTQRGYALSLNILFTWLLRYGIDPIAATRAELELFIHQHLEDERKLTPASVGHHITILRGYYRIAFIDETITKDPSVALRTPKVWRDPYRIEFVTGDEMRALIAASRRSDLPEDQGLIALLALLGLRVSEAMKGLSEGVTGAAEALDAAGRDATEACEADAGDAEFVVDLPAAAPSIASSVTLVISATAATGIAMIARTLANCFLRRATSASTIASRASRSPRTGINPVTKATIATMNAASPRPFAGLPGPEEGPVGAARAFTSVMVASVAEWLSARNDRIVRCAPRLSAGLPFWPLGDTVGCTGGLCHGWIRVIPVGRTGLEPVTDGL